MSSKGVLVRGEPVVRLHCRWIFHHHSPPKQYKPDVKRTDLEKRKLKVFLSALNATANGLSVTPDEVMLVLDSGASCTLTLSMYDFISPIKQLKNTYISGMA